MIKRILSVLCTAAVMLSLATAVMAQEGYSITFPEDEFQKISENKYYSDSFYVNDDQYEITAEITVEDFDDSFDPYSEGHLRKLKQDIITDLEERGYNSINFKKEPSVIRVTSEYYHCINTQYSAKLPGNDVSHGFTNFRIYTPEKLYNIKFSSTSWALTMMSTDYEIVNTLKIDNYSKATGANVVKIPETAPEPVQPAQPSAEGTPAEKNTSPSADNNIITDIETESSSKNEGIAVPTGSNPIIILGIAAAIIVVIIILAYFMSMSAKKRAAKKIQKPQSGNYRPDTGNAPTSTSAKQHTLTVTAAEVRPKASINTGNTTADTYTAVPSGNNTENSNTASVNNTSVAVASGVMLDDVTYIRDIKQSAQGLWHKFDILIAARPYGWDYMVDSADYMAKADLEDISQLIRSTKLVENGNDLISRYHENGNNIKGIAELEKEGAMLSVAGLSRALKAPMKILWFNQTNTLAFYTLSDDTSLIRRYAESVIRRNFGTADEMKLGKPLEH